jgi:hypothetical protein
MCVCVHPLTRHACIHVCMHLLTLLLMLRGRLRRVDMKAHEGAQQRDVCTPTHTDKQCSLATIYTYIHMYTPTNHYMVFLLCASPVAGQPQYVHANRTRGKCEYMYI